MAISLLLSLSICLKRRFICIIFVIIITISLFFEAFLSLTYVAYAFSGIQICVIYLIMSAGLKMLKGLKKTPFNVVMITLTATVMVASSLLSVSFSTVFYILIGGAVGVISYLICIFSKVKKDVKEANNK